MAAPILIQDCIKDIQAILLPQNQGKYPLYIPPMGAKGGSGCHILSTNMSNGEIEIMYRDFPKLIIRQEDYTILEKRFNSLDFKKGVLRDGRPEKYGVNRYNKPKWNNIPFGCYLNPLLPSIFKALGY